MLCDITRNKLQHYGNQKNRINVHNNDMAWKHIFETIIDWLGIAILDQNWGLGLVSGMENGIEDCEFYSNFLSHDKPYHLPPIGS